MHPLVRIAALGTALATGCNGAPRTGDVAEPSRSAHTTTPSGSRPSPSSMAASSTPSAATPARAPDASPSFSVDEARALLFPEGIPNGLICEGPAHDAILCLLGARYTGDARGTQAARDLFVASGSIAGVEKPHRMDGGFRGEIAIVSELPVGRYAKHLDWVVAAESDSVRFVARLENEAPGKVRYRVKPIGYKFMRSVGRTTPSAYAHDWRVGYNVSGSLHANAEAVRDTLFHEIFHLNDEAHRDWSRRVLGARYDALVARCGTKISCLAPYAPMKTMVRGGTFYAFQPDNGDGVHEYGAELATRYFRETLAALDGKPYGEKSFKCGTPENAASFQALADEFFGGIDLTPRCP